MLKVEMDVDENGNQSGDDAMDIDDLQELEMLRKYQARTGGGRKSVAAERYNPDEDDDEPLKVVPKTDSQRERLKEVSNKIMLLNRLDEEQLTNVINAMEERKINVDDIVIQQGADGDNFYVIDSGKYDVYINKENGPEQVFTYNDSGFFGELALMYNTPRAATVKCSKAGVIWSLDRKTFRQIIVKANAKKRSQYEAFLQTVEILQNLDENEISKVADVMEEKKYKSGEAIIRQGDEIDAGSFVYFLISGTCKIHLNIDGEEKVLDKVLQSGQCFGEVALITKAPRNATIIASEDVKCGVLDVSAFERLLGPCKEIMNRNIDKYEEELAALKELKISD
ncbi:Oidioi.mRNA.OKI2018_I69.PAR.g12719.t1.cds [Oikopleura dioica]|uniref:Oidioi.mRNA.OKI2018_I69.PAR.g12719.t1.cds n=1 Tax=Oikopleura dioica TaxID=34765 RepID=A0ABN7S1D7_OIKDI|nr:Oidioi.mRNA.OKI2018_I69.PAR.g12719.t1.cds [Oikopleura dioica]